MPRRIPTARAPSLGPTAAELERDAFYTSRPWRDLRAAFLEANPLCEECAEAGRDTPADTAHHRIERLKAPWLALVWSNLVASCSPCHTRHHKRKSRRP